MTKIITTFTLPELTYHDNKKEIKKLFKEYGMDWKGYYPDHFKWTDGMNEVKAEFLKDGEVTVEAKLIYNGENEAPFYEVFSNYLKENIGGLDIQFENQQIVMDRVEEEREEYKKNVQATLDGMKRDGAPEGFIELRRKDLMSRCP